MTVRAKFKVQSIMQSAGWGGHNRIFTVRLTPVMGSGPNAENAAFYAATPSGSIELGMTNEAVGEQFAIGQDFYVDFTPVVGDA